MFEQEIFGTRIVQSNDLVDFKLVNHPKYRSYKWLRKFEVWRILRIKYLNWLRKRYREKDSNWIKKPSTKAIKMPDGTLVVHPTMYAKIKASTKCT
ncbi:MAG: hypothetical protein CL666_14650 [Balneola sp.]|nr:hypothetical protein [Balneola sp.]|tara:strand:+ start:694 stop:981 length:288 start_codon:yes stop_codon:yes gene_type:complete